MAGMDAHLQLYGYPALRHLWEWIDFVHVLEAQYGVRHALYAEIATFRTDNFDSNYAIFCQYS